MWTTAWQIATLFTCVTVLLAWAAIAAGTAVHTLMWGSTGARPPSRGKPSDESAMV